MPRLNISADDWAVIRARWEEDPKISFGEAGRPHGASRQAVSLRAQKEGWQKRGELSSINAAASRKADAMSDPHRHEGESEPRQVDDPGALKRRVGREEAEDKRAAVIVKHRDQICMLDAMQRAAQNLFATAAQSMLKDDWWRAKIAADTVKEHCVAARTKQELERRAWSLDVIIDPASFRTMTDEQLQAIVNGRPGAGYGGS